MFILGSRIRHTGFRHVPWSRGWEEEPGYRSTNEFRGELTAAGLSLAGLSPDGQLVEIVELSGHPWFVGVQFHPELKSRPNKAHPLFREFVAAAVKYSK